jgi:predicted transcriptional regulator
MATYTKKTLYLEDEAWAKLDRLSDKTGAPVSELIRRAVRDYSDRQMKPAEKAKRGVAVGGEQ